jgi:hypothetical protein
LRFRRALDLGLASLSRLEQDARNPDRARDLAEEGLTVASGCGFTRAVCISLVSLGDVFHEQSDFVRAGRVFQEAGVAAGRARDPIFASYASSGLARVALDQGDLGVARDELIAALSGARQIGEKRAMAHAVEYCGRIGGRNRACDRSAHARIRGGRGT